MDVSKMSDHELAAWASRLKSEIKSLKAAMRAMKRVDVKQYTAYAESLSIRQGSLTAVELEEKMRKAEARRERSEERKERREERRDAWRSFWDKVWD